MALNSVNEMLLLLSTVLCDVVIVSVREALTFRVCSPCRFLSVESIL